MQNIGQCSFSLFFRLIFTASLLTMLPACNDGPESPKGFSLPVGDAQEGKTVFVDYNCMACHAIESLPMRAAELANIEMELEERILLGGDVTRVMTYAELVTAIINPSHRIAKQYQSEKYLTNDISAMKNYNDVMTVTDLIHLVAFLQPHYKLLEYHHTQYGIYP